MIRPFFYYHSIGCGINRYWVPIYWYHMHIGEWFTYISVFRREKRKNTYKVEMKNTYHSTTSNRGRKWSLYAVWDCQWKIEWYYWAGDTILIHLLCEDELQHHFGLIHWLGTYHHLGLIISIHTVPTICWACKECIA